MVDGKGQMELFMLIEELEEQLKDRPVLLAFLKPLFQYLNIPYLVEVNANKPNELWLESVTEGYKLIKAHELDFRYWLSLCHILANGNGLHFDPVKQPKVSVELPGGHRFEAAIGDVSKKKLSVSIRLRRKLELQLEDFGVNAEDKERLIDLIKRGANIVVSGGTSSGKTTFLNCLLKYIPKDKRILSVEDTYELDIQQYNQVNYIVSRNETNPAIGYPQIIDHLLRSRPDMIVCGEVSVANAFPILRMLNSGHAGFMCTVHANTPDLALTAAIPQNIVMAGIDVPNVDELLYQLIDVVIQLHKMPNGKREVTNILYPKEEKRGDPCKD